MRYLKIIMYRALQLARYNDTLVAAYDKNVLLFRLNTAAKL